MKYTSLCYIPVRSDNGQYWVQRIADLRNNVFVPFAPRSRDRHPSRTPENMDQFPIMDPYPFDSGEIGVFDWTGEWNKTKNRTDVFDVRYREDCDPIQIVAMNFNAGGTDEERALTIAEHLRKDGFSTPIYARRLFVLVSKGKALYLTSENFNADGKLDVGIIHCHLIKFDPTTMREANFDIKGGRRIVFSYYGALSVLGDNIIPLYRSVEVIRNLIVRKVSWPVVKAKGFTRKEKDIFDKVIKELDLQSFEDELAQILNCTLEEAKSELGRFKENATNIDLLDGDDGLLDKFFERNEQFRNKSIAEGEKRWRAQNEAIIQEEKAKKDAILTDKCSQIEEAEGKLREIEDTIDKQKTQIAENEEKISKQEEAKQRKENEIARVEESVRERLASIQADIPTALAEMSVLKHFLSSNTQEQRTTGYTPGSVPADAPAQFDNAITAWKCLRDNLQFCGCSSTKGAIAAVWLLGCAVRRQPLLLVGAAAESFAAAISLSLFGMHPAVLDCASGEIRQSEEDLLSDAPPVCIIRSPFAPEWIGRIPGLVTRSLGKSLFLCCTSSHEDLVVEPPSFFQTILPFLTDVFAESPPVFGFEGFGPGLLMDDVVMRYQKYTPENVPDAKELRLIPVAKKRLGGISATISQFENDCLPYTGRLIARKLGGVLPLAIATGKNGLVTKLAESLNLNDEAWDLSAFLP